MAKAFFDWIFAEKRRKKALEDRDRIRREHQHQVDLDNIEKEYEV